MFNRRAIWQGRSDCLCGIYCAAYLVRNSLSLPNRSADRDQRALYWLLKSAEALGILNAEYLAGADGGYRCDQIRDIFNGMPGRFQSGFKAFEINEHFPKYAGKLSDLAVLFELGGYAMIDVDQGKHWILVTALDDEGVGLCFDPSKDKKIKTRKRASSEEGVIFVPKERLVELNA